MKQVASIISIYAADVSGVASALFELGGMTVIHDPSGCNSTYNTHDEPRWYDMDSMVYISGLMEMDAIMGNDDKLIHDVEEAASELSPAFITLCGSPIPMMMGTDFKAIASVIEHDTGIPCFGLSTNSMHSYFCGAGSALEAVAGRLVEEPRPGTGQRGNAVNILGMTPIDFSVNGTDRTLRGLLAENGFDVVSCWAMGSTLDEIRRSAEAGVNLVVSSAGMAPARELNRRFGTPYVAGFPAAGAFAQKVMADLRLAADSGRNIISYAPDEREPQDEADVVFIGEQIINASVAAALEAETGIRARVITLLDTEDGLLRPGDIKAEDETDIIPVLSKAGAYVADPMYRFIAPEGTQFVSLPHEAFSGRIYRKEIPDLAADCTDLFQRIRKALG